jgi:chemotaxis methyl-accepting protein methylase
MLLEEQDIAGRVVATDISMPPATSRSSPLPREELSGLSPHRIANYFRPTADGWQINATIRNRVTVLSQSARSLPPDVQSCHVVSVATC